MTDSSELNFREIRVTETGIHLDDQRIPVFTLGPNVLIGAEAGGSQTITLTIHADRIVFEGEAKATLALPDNDPANRDAYPKRDDLTLQSAMADLNAKIDRLATYGRTKPEA